MPALPKLSRTLYNTSTIFSNLHGLCAMPSSLIRHRTLTNATTSDYHSSLLTLQHNFRKPGNWRPKLIHSSSSIKWTVIRVPPGGEVPAHYHNEVWDYFIALEGVGVVETKEYGGEGERKDSSLVERQYEMPVGSFLAMPPGDVHRVRNRLGTNEEATGRDFVFLLAQSPRDKYNFVDATSGENKGDWGDYSGH
jgi:mannose-6-phosphate isomerase-like protein (cupin superfamily)